MSTLPTGTVTFLFTDIEGSTTRWEQQREVMQAALARHDAILRKVIEAHGGYIFKTGGDAFCAAFASAPAAATAALATQRVVAGEPWSNGCEIRVRMALHSGVAEERDGDYFGPPLNRVGRLLAACHGGQMLLSAATHELVRDVLPRDTSLRDLGEQRLKDLIRPEHIYQLAAPDLRTDFPAIRTLDIRPHNLPLQRHPLLGREAEMADVTALLRRPEVGLVTLTGVGGTGKTRLALQIAAELIDDFPQGVFFVALAPYIDPDRVAATIAQTLGVRTAAGQPALVSIIEYAWNKQLLLILDNFEQLLAAAPLVADLLSGAPKVKVLVTSRTPLRLSAEYEYPVSPLPLPDIKHLPPLETLIEYPAVELFIQRAQAVKPTFQVTSRTAPAIAQICSHLDGLPLAIELAAARSKMLPPETLLVRLDRRLALLTGGARDLPVRQQTLRNTIDWSYGLLESDEQTLFARLAVFAGGSSLEAAEAACGEGLTGNVLDTMQSLVDKSLVQQVEGADEILRFRMLETIREYAVERLASSGQQEALRRKHAAYYRALLEQAEPHLKGHAPGEWLERLEQEHENLGSMLTWALEQDELEAAAEAGLVLWIFWWVRGHVADGRRWMERVAERASDGSLARARALAVAGVLASCENDVSAAASLAERCLLDLRSLGDGPGQALATLTLGLQLRRRGDHARGTVLLEESLELYRNLDDQYGVLLALAMLTYGPITQGNFELAVTLCESALAVNRSIGSPHMLAVIHNNFANALALLGHYERAMLQFDSSLRIARELGDSVLITFLNTAGNCAAVHNDFARALPLLEECVALARKVGDPHRLANYLNSLGIVLIFTGKLEQGAQLLRESLQLGKQLQHFYVILWCFIGIAGLASRRSDPQGGARLLGATAMLQAGTVPPLDRLDQQILDRITAEIREQLDDTTFDVAWTAGQALTIEQAIAYALEQDTWPTA